MGVEPTTFSLGRRHSTGELRPRSIDYIAPYFICHPGKDLGYMK